VDVTWAYEAVVGFLLLIDVASAALLLVFWYFWFARYNHRRAANVLRWVQAACAGKGQIRDCRWLGSSCLHARLQLASRLFENANLTVQLMPRPVPMRWLMSRWQKQKETLTFEADLDCAPAFRLEVFNHRWSGQNRKALGPDTRRWTISRPGAVVLTTRDSWAQELTPVVNALMASREKNFLNVRFHPKSPNFSATIALETLSDPQAAAGMLAVLRELAEGASAKHL
jgi:hypothetical protein